MMGVGSGVKGGKEGVWVSGRMMGYVEEKLEGGGEGGRLELEGGFGRED